MRIIKCLLVKLAANRLVPMSDKQYLSLKYEIVMGKKVSFTNPVTFNEKLQWLKLYDRNPNYTKMVDKAEVKNIIAAVIGDKYIIPTIGVYDSFDDIDFDKLPNRFVVKCTHDSGGLVVCRNKKSLDINKAKRKINKCLKHNFFYVNREWPYKNVKPKIIIEKYMEDKNSGKELRDYKFYCFNGEPKYLYVSEGLENHATARIGFFDMDFKPAPFGRFDYKRFDKLPVCPKNFDKMKEIAKVLSDGKSFVRVDLYEINGKIYFGELTFTPCAGYMPFDPPEWDIKLGDMLSLPRREHGPEV